MTSVLVAGVGTLGSRLARQLVDMPSIDRVLLASRRPESLADLCSSLGASAEAIGFRPGDRLPEGVDAVACALPDELDALVARSAIEAGIPCASAADGSGAIATLRALDGAARDAGLTIAAGCGFAPGLADVLALHASALFDAIDEVRIARCGWAGPASGESVRRERRDVQHLFRAEVANSGTWAEVAKLEEQVWFPDPISARDCQVVRGAGDLYVAAQPEIRGLTTLLADAPRGPLLGKRGDDGLGAIRVEVWGQRDNRRDVVVYGALDRVSIAAGAVLALATEMLADRGRYLPPGVHGLSALVEPVAFLGELATRGVRAAAFDGAPVG